MTATVTPALQYTMRARTLIGLLFTEASTPLAIRAAFRKVYCNLSRMPIGFELCTQTYTALRRIQRTLRRRGYGVALKRKAAARVIRLTLDVLQACRASW